MATGLLRRAEGAHAAARRRISASASSTSRSCSHGDTYAVQISFIAEILKPPPVTEVPRAPRDVIGVMSVRGRLVTVIDLRRRFKLQESPPDRKTRILLVDMGDEQIGMLVDEVLQVYRLADTEIEPAHVLGGDQPAHIAGIGRPEGALLILIDLKPILER